MTESFVADRAGIRLDVYLAEKTGKTRSAVLKAIEQGQVLVNDALPVKAGVKIEQGDRIRLDIPEPRPISASPQDIPIDIVYEDEDIVIVNKAQGMVTHPASGSPDGTLVNALLHRVSGLSGINGEIRPGIVHRLDKDTSGLLVVAKNDQAHLSLSEQISTKKALRYYYALVVGNIAADEGKVDKSIARSHKDRKQMAVDEEGRSALTLYKVIARFPGYTLIECELRTGRTHQIRVHMKSIGHPVVGDPVYGKPSPLAPHGQLLHAHKLVLFHPRTGEKMTFEAPVNEAFAAALKKLGYQQEI
ncbi:MAG TPA: RluA family pseudouridine synthase [Clostridiales bacterium]|nr:RluA family pseudouridine synthase [Clostridiales bacterium]